MQNIISICVDVLMSCTRLTTTQRTVDLEIFVL